MPKDFGRETDRYCVLELRAALAGAEEPPDAPAEIADAVSAIRLATAAPLSAGPVLFETLDGRPFGIRPVLPIAATQPPGEATRLDSFRGALAGELLVGSASPTPTARSPRRSIAGSCRCSSTSRSAPISFAPRSGAPRRDVAAAGRLLLETEPERGSALHAELTGLAAGSLQRDRGGCRSAGARRGAPAR